MQVRAIRKTPELVRSADGTNLLHQWIDERDLGVGRTVHLDVIEPEFKYGLRAPGERATYEIGRPDQSLASIARELDE
ncbi:MAG: hypothetical protein ABEI52_05700 [Halobacteriaceae archaeon]